MRNFVVFLLFFLREIFSGTVITVPKMDCNTVYEINKGFKPISIEIDGLKRNIEVIITDQEIEKSKCEKKTLEIRDFCQNSNQFCKGSFF